jgi:hypothetical protein
VDNTAQSGTEVLTEQAQQTQTEATKETQSEAAVESLPAKSDTPKSRRKHPKVLCSFDGCDRNSLAHGLCWTHYQQQRRGRPLTPIRQKGLLLLPGNVRVLASVHDAIQKRITDGKAKTLYEATRQAIVAGVEYWTKGGK